MQDVAPAPIQTMTNQDARPAPSEAEAPKPTAATGEPLFVSGNPEKTSALAFKDALRASRVAFGLATVLLLPLVGLKTEPAPGGLTLIPRLDIAMCGVLAIVAVRLAADLLLWRTAAPAAHRIAAFLALVFGAAVGGLAGGELWAGVDAFADFAAGPAGAAPGAGLSFGRQALRQTIGLFGHAAPPAVGALVSLRFLWPVFAPLGALVASAPFVLRLAAGRLALGLVIAAGGLFYFWDGSRALFIEGAADWLGGDADLGERIIRIAAKMFSLVAIGVFIVIAAMLAVRMVRLVVSIASGRAEPPPPDLDSQTEALWANLGREFTPGLLAIALTLPLVALGPEQRYALDTATQVMTYIMLGWGLNVVVGLAGLLDLGYVAFYAVGAYTYGLLATHYEWSFWVCLPLAGLFAALWGVMLGFPVLRLRGDYLAIVTLAFGEIIRVVLINWTSLTNGSNGLSVPKLTFFGKPFDASTDGFAALFGLQHAPIHRVIFLYYVILTLALVTNFITVRLRRLPIGRAWEALREDEIACRSLGLNTTVVKLSAFATGAAFGGLAGSFFGAHHGLISPESFTFQESALILAIVVLGGLGSQTGVVIAAVALIGVSELFRELAQYRMLIFGASMVVIMTWKPRGLIAHRTATVALKERKAIGGALVSQGKG